MLFILNLLVRKVFWGFILFKISFIKIGFGIVKIVFVGSLADFGYMFLALFFRLMVYCRMVFLFLVMFSWKMVLIFFISWVFIFLMWWLMFSNTRKFWDFDSFRGCGVACFWVDFRFLGLFFVLILGWWLVFFYILLYWFFWFCCLVCESLWLD